MINLTELESRCFPEDGPRTPPTPDETTELLRLVREARGIISGARDAMRDMGCHPSTYETFDEWLKEVE